MSAVATRPHVEGRARPRPNVTAENVAAARALSALDDPEPVRNPDYLAEEFLGTKFRVIRRVPPLRRLAQRMWERMIPGICGYLNARTHHIDQLLLAEIDAGVDQVVVLGAGYDTRAYRFAAQLAGCRVYEVDEPATQARKVAIMTGLLTALPSRVGYVSLDFAQDDVMARLREAGYDPCRRAFFVWEGVSYYLAPDDVDALLRCVAAGAAPGSTIVFDYLYNGVLDGSREYPDARGAVEYLKRHGLPYRFGIPEGECAAYLAQRGWTLVSDLDPHDMQTRYLRMPDGSLSAPAFQAYGMATARRTG